MRSTLRFFATWFALFASLSACAGSSPPPQTGGPADPPPSASAAAPSDPKTAHVVVIGISDFHGWLSPLEPKGFGKFYGGIANIGAMLAHKEKLDPASSIIVDNGDMWTGPTESTFLRGEPVIQAYNELGVTAVNIANHEFDFGTEVLKAREAEAHFPFLGANIAKAGTKERPAFAKPYTIVERDGVKVAIVGLSYEDTPHTTLATHVAGLEFRPYGEVLKEVVPEVKAQGAEAVVVLFHDTAQVIGEVLKTVPGLGITAVVAGQDHRKSDTTIEGTPVVNPGPFGRSYVRFDVAVDRASHQATVSYQIVDVSGEVAAPAFPPAPKLVAVAEAARQKAQSLSSEVLGRLSIPLPVGSFGDSPLGNLIADSWLAAFPKADVAICNHGAIRQPLGAGPVTIGDLIGTIPFENNLYLVHLTGKQLKEQLAIDGPAVAGLTWKYKQTPKGRTVVGAVDKAGQPINDAKKYAVVINDFMYFGGDGYGFKDVDATPEDTGLSIREPLIRMLRAAEAGSHAVEPQTGARAAKAH
jgi:2',3'-cyclic-nucleotide 2'-phosphodiesterase (5'-nucleotidase family)